MTRYRRADFDEHIREILGAAVDAQDAIHHAERETAALVRGSSRNRGVRRSPGHSDLTAQAAAIHQDWLEARLEEARQLAQATRDFAGRCRGFVGQDAPTDPQRTSGQCANPACWRDAEPKRSRCRACRKYLSDNGHERPAELCERDRERNVYSGN